MLSDTTTADLEELLAEVDTGWCAYRQYGIAAVSFGIGGCLIQQMGRLLDRQQITDSEFDHRRDDMIAALGFMYNGAPSAPAMFRWNDKQRYPDVIKHRIKDALNGELDVK
jgi:hypothetical protein